MHEERGSGARDTREIVKGCPSTMGDHYQLNTTTLIRHAARTHADQEIVYRTPTGGWDRYTYGDCYARTCRAANAFRALGIGPGDRVGVLDWNSRRYFELYYAIPGLGAVMLQLNLRLGADDLSYIIDHSHATFICVDESLLPLAEAIAPRAPTVSWIVMTDKPVAELSTTLRQWHHHEELLAAAASTFDWPMIDERSAYAACYTTGTTGRPKGVYYSHRSIYLHSTAIVANLGMRLDDCTMLIAPMFHAQGWGMPQAATLMANKIVLPGRYSMEDTAPLVDAIIAEGVSVTNGTSTILSPMLHYIETLPVKADLSRLRILCGGSEPPLSMMIGFHETAGAEVVHAYGGTETSPAVTMNRLKPTLSGRMITPSARWNLRRSQGLPLAGVDIKILGPDDRELAHDGRSVGEICVRGPWITTKYYDMPDAADRFVDGYWRSGDVGSIDQNGYLKLCDRIKDVIKSGGEWISSIDMENALMGHPAVREAAVVGIPDPKWQERPLALVVLNQGHQVTLQQLREHLSKAFAKWQMPDQVLFVECIPKTSVGKLNKKLIRAEYAALYGQQRSCDQ